MASLWYLNRCASHASGIGGYGIPGGVSLSIFRNYSYAASFTLSAGKSSGVPDFSLFRAQVVIEDWLRPISKKAGSFR
jgi:hypothetical protein